MDRNKYGVQPREPVSDNYSERLFNCIKRFEQEQHRVTNAVSVVNSDSDSISVLVVRNNPVDEDLIETESLYINHNTHPLFLVHTMLLSLYGILVKNGLTPSVDIGLVVKVPKQYQKEIGQEEVIVKMGEDLGQMDAWLQDKITDALINHHFDGLLREFLGMKVRKEKGYE